LTKKGIAYNTTYCDLFILNDFLCLQFGTGLLFGFTLRSLARAVNKTLGQGQGLSFEGQEQRQGLEICP